MDLKEHGAEAQGQTGSAADPAPGAQAGTQPGVPTGSHARSEVGPLLPRRAFLAAGLSGLVAAGAVGLAQLGGLTQVARASFRFSRGVAFATGEEARLRGFLVPALQDDRLFVTMIGHTSQSGEASANLALSLRRAEGAAQLAQSMGLPAARLNVQGVGGAAPLAKDSDESDRAFQSRLARVDVTLQRRM